MSETTKNTENAAFDNAGSGQRFEFRVVILLRT